MKILLVTDKFSPVKNYKDGGSSVVHTLKDALKERLSIMQFGGEKTSLANWRYDYSISLSNRFAHRIANAEYIATKVKEVEKDFSHIIFLHISMQFGFSKIPFGPNAKIWTFPMFLSPSYEQSGEIVPEEYKKLEANTISNAQNIITPSYMEKRQLTEIYNFDYEKIHVIPRGINSSFLTPQTRTIFDPKNETIKLCTIGSIKSQKNIISLINLFNMINLNYIDSELHIIGPIQDNDYYQKIKERIRFFGLEKKIFFPGHISHENLPKYIKNFHVHLSASKCETFGRSIFETLALGIPNIVVLHQNAAFEFLKDLPYIKFVKNNLEATYELNKILSDLPILSKLAQEIGEFYDDKILKERIVARIFDKETLVISDYDGTIFYKNDEKKTSDFIKKFNKYSKKIICSARPLSFLIKETKNLDIKYDWLISYGGAVISDNKQNIIDIKPLDIFELESLYKISDKYEKIIFDNKIILLSIRMEEIDLRTIPQYLNIEIYEGIIYIGTRKASKLHASQRLLQIIEWKGNIDSFGNSEYDKKFLTYFSGQFITSNNNA